MRSCINKVGVVGPAKGADLLINLGSRLRGDDNAKQTV